MEASFERLGFVGDLLSALASEADVEAPREEAWALAIGGPVGFLGPILKAAEREGIRDGVIEALGAARGARMPEGGVMVAPGLLVAALGSPSGRIRTEAHVALLGDAATRGADLELKPTADRQGRIARRLFEAARGLSSEIQLDRETSHSMDEDARVRDGTDDYAPARSPAKSASSVTNSTTPLNFWVMGPSVARSGMPS